MDILAKHNIKISTADQKDELMKVHNKVKELTNYEMFLFRPPYGNYNNNVITNATDCGYYTIQWDVDSMISKFKEQGYEFVPISELIYKENYHMNHEGRQIFD